MSEVIPAEAIEAAADLIIQGDRGACECRRSIFDKHDVNPPCSTRRQALRVARAALEAAAPYIRETVTEWAAAFRLTGEPYNFHRTREEAQAFVDDMSKQDVDMVVMTREVLPAQAREWAPYMLNTEGEK